MGSEHPRGDYGYFLWAAAGFLLSFGFVSVLTLPLLAVGLILGVWLYVRGPGWPADLGLLAGFGLTCLVIAGLAAGARGLDPIWWAIAGAVLTSSSTATFWWLRCRPGVERPSAR
jgi:hypothetical protein